MNGVAEQIGLGHDVALKPERGLLVTVLLTKGMGAAGSMEVRALVRGPRKDAFGSLRPTCGTGDIPRTS